MKIAQSKIGRIYGWHQPKVPHNTKLYRVELASEVVSTDQLPESVDLRSKCLPVYDQGQLGSCSANAIAGAIEFLQPGFMPSRLFIYYNERSIEGTTDQDAGAEITDGVKSIVTTGVCSETDWPYDISKFTQKPSDNCYSDAKNDILSQYLQINGVQEMKSCLAQGFPFVFGFAVYESFESAQVASTGVMPIPNSNEQCLGGHAVMACGYDSTKGIFIVKNSWGTGWGDGGFFYMPESYITNTNLASEFLTVRK